MNLVRRFCCGFLLSVLSFGFVGEVVQGQELPEHFAVGPLPEGVELPLPRFDGFHAGIGKCLEEVPTSTLFKNAKTIPAGNGSNPYLSIVEHCCDGYKRYKYDAKLCVPKCTTKCRNGFCVAPNVCVCFIDHVRSMDDECVTTCPIGCLNGQCHMNGTCTCNPGYTLEPNRQYCVPVCSKSCGVNANCTAPEQCSCLRGYRLNAMAECEPICAPSCGNGICVGPNQCHCHPGYTLIDRSCQANCTRGCHNGRCIQNDVCVCDVGYTLVANGTKCEPICSKGCDFGNCTGPEHCTCFTGYEIKDSVCKPACKRGCKRGECIRPDTCVCGIGFTMNPQGNECKPVCENGCVHGRCTAPNKCICNSGYYNINGVCTRRSSTTSAPNHYVTMNIVPKFNPTVHVQPGPTPSQTFPPNSYTTRPWFTPSVVVQPSQNNPRPANHTNSIRPANHTNSAFAHCSRSCLNGNCVGHDMCQCNIGYALEFGTWHKCTPYCQGGCPNGQCTSPNFCACNYGFIKRNGTCTYQFA